MSIGERTFKTSNVYCGRRISRLYIYMAKQKGYIAKQKDIYTYSGKNRENHIKTIYRRYKPNLSRLYMYGHINISILHDTKVVYI